MSNELLTALVICLSKKFWIPKLNRNKENIATTKDGINVNTENIDIYFKFV